MQSSIRVVAATLGMIVLSAVPSHSATNDEVIAERRAGYKHMGQIFGEMKTAVEAAAPVSPFESKAQEIVDWARRIPSMFPPGTETGGGTRAKPEIWTERAKFDELSAELVEKATALKARAAANDVTGFSDAWKATGQVCGSCHRAYRARAL